MDQNADILKRLFTALNRHDHVTMGACYAEHATFSDIAFELSGRPRIHAMWRMICDGDIRATFEMVETGDGHAIANVVDDYTFRSTGRKVHNVIQSRFRFENGSIVDQRDTCDPRLWASMALGGVSGVLAGRLGFVRRWKARKTLDAFLRQHPERTRHRASRSDVRLPG